MLLASVVDALGKEMSIWNRVLQKTECRLQLNWGI
jgi:hypothetical protein